MWEELKYITFFHLKLMNTNIWIPQKFSYIENLTILKILVNFSIFGRGVGLLLNL